MTEIRGKPCIVSKIQLSSIVVTMLTGDIWAIHPLMLTKDGVDSVSFEMEHHFRKGDKVKVKLMEIEEMKKLQKGNGGWSSQLATHMNKTGVIVSIQKGRVCIVKMDNGERTAFYRACLTLVEPAAKKESSSDSSDSSDDSSDDDEIKSMLQKALLGPLKTKLKELGALGELDDTTKAKAVSEKGPAELIKVIQQGDKSAIGTILSCALNG
ncbi:uncharacterized protein [Amphiura filiformis]|uniref:uncharacterized protein n=1 Tax=Amphiura filiformis TaxID=82378 RepID=UPI003B2262C5